MNRPSPAKELKAVENFNKVNEVGCPVRVTKDDGTTVETITTSQAQLLGGHSAVIFLKGISGCYSLHRCRPVI